MIDVYESLNRRRGKGVSDEDEESYILGFNDALAAMDGKSKESMLAKLTSMDLHDDTGHPEDEGYQSAID